MKTQPGASSKALSAQEYAAIHLRVEHPDLPAWLNEMIRKSRRDEFAKAAMREALDETKEKEDEQP